MFNEVDEALRVLVRAEVVSASDIDVVFDAPTKEWSSRRNAPTVNLYLYDIREDLRRRERGLINSYDDRGVIVSRRQPPRHFKVSYLITAWTQRPEDEHRLLSSLLYCFLRNETLPTELLSGRLAESGLPVTLSVALPPPEDRAFADVWSALGGGAQAIAGPGGHRAGRWRAPVPGRSSGAGAAHDRLRGSRGGTA